MAAVHDACLGSGFFVAVGHGLDRLVDAAFAAMHALFALPQVDKERVAMVDRRGYVPRAADRLDPSLHGAPMEYYDVGLDGPNPWPPLDGFEGALRAYQQGALQVAADLLRAMATGLDLEEQFFADRMHDPECFLRFMHYRPDPANGASERRVLTDAHTDYGAITLLATDGVGGLEVCPRGDTWTPVVAPPGSLVVNLGDMLARWTNLRYASTPHRVVAPTDAHRYSIPFFVNPDRDTVVRCIPSCVTDSDPCRFEPVTAGEFLAQRIADGGYMES
ncbi:oxidoreductase [soil metagenome]